MPLSIYLMTTLAASLLKLQVLPLMYMFELQDLLFAIKSLTFQFNIQDYINFSSASIYRPGGSNKLVIPRHLNNISTFIDCQLFGMPSSPLIWIYHFICSNLNYMITITVHYTVFSLAPIAICCTLPQQTWNNLCI